MDAEWDRHLPGSAARVQPPDQTGATLPRMWAEAWARDAGRPVLCDAAGGWMSCGQIEQRSRRVAGRLLGAGLSAGDRVLVSAEPSVSLIVVHVACLRAGLVVVPANTAYRAAELAHIVGDAEPSAAIIDDRERGAWIGGTAPSILTTGVEVELPDAEPPQIDAADAADPALIGYTSGTTGRPKGAVLSHGNLLAGAEALRTAWRWTPDDRLVLALPLFHMHGLGVGVHGTLLAGASAVVLPRFETGGVVEAAGTHRATMFFGVPTMYARLISSARAGELSALRLLVSGSAPLAPDLFARIREACGQPPLERYGMTETIMLASNPVDGERRPGTVGFALPQVHIRLDGAPEGEILVKGPNVFDGYWRRPDASAQAFDDGWFRTGDIGSRDAHGYLRIVGRAKELIISGGYNVYPREVEDVIRSHPAVEDVAVTGTPSAEWGEVVTAWVVASEDLIETSRLTDFVRERLAPYKVPRIVHRVADLPRNALGKVQKHLLG